MKYFRGDVTYPQTKNPCIIPHIVNDIGIWGSGVVVAISKRWSRPKFIYEKDHENANLRLGNTTFINVASNPDIYIANMCAQKNVGLGEKYIIGKIVYNQPPIRYDSLLECMFKVGEYASDNNLEIHAPKFGSDRAGGDWVKIQQMIKELWIDNGLNVIIYEYPD